MLLVSGNEFSKRVDQHANVLHAAENAGVELLAYTSIPQAQANPMILAQEHTGTEAVLAEAKIPTTLLRNSWYWENYTGGLAHTVESGVLYGAARDGKVSGASRVDYADAAARVLTTDGHAGKVYELGGDTHSYAELAQVISEVSGKPVRYQDLPEDDYAAALAGAGLDAGYAAVLADADTGIADGVLTVDTGDLERLLGRPVTPAADVFRAALS